MMIETVTKDPLGIRRHRVSYIGTKVSEEPPFPVGKVAAGCAKTSVK